MKRPNKIIFLLLSMVVTLSFAGCGTPTSQENSKTSEISSTDNGNGDITLDGNDVQGTGTTTSGGSTSSKTPGTGVVSGGAISKVTDLKGRTIKIGMSDWQGDKSFTTEMGKYLKARVTATESKYNCKIQIENIPDFNPVFTAIAANNTPFDIINANGPHQIPIYMKGKLIQPLDDLGIDFSDTRFYKPVTDALTFNGKHYGLQRTPQGLDKIANNWVLLYNKRLITEDLFAVQSSGNWTWQKMYDVAKALKQSKPDITAIEDNQFYMYSSLVFSNNSDWIKKSGTTITFDAGNANAKEALDYYKKLSDDGLMRAAINNGDQAGYKDFRNGKVGMIIDFASRLWTSSYYQGMTDDYGVLYLPKGPKSTDYVSPDVYYYYYVIPTGVKNTTEVGAVLNEFLAPLIPAAQEKGIFRTQCQSISRDSNSLNVLLNITSKNQLKNPWLIGNFLQWGVWYQQLENITKNGASPQTAIDSNTTAYNKLISDNFNF